MEKDWVNIFSSNQLYTIEAVKSLLDENDIVFIEINKKDSSYPTFGETEIYVNYSEVVKVKQLLAKNKYE